MRASLARGSAGVGCAGSAGVGAADQERSQAHRERGHRDLGSHSAQQSGQGRIHLEARQPRQVLRSAQTGDCQEGRLLGTDRPDETATEDQIRLLGAASPT